MKKTLFMLGLMFTALTLSNCTKTEEQDVVPGKPNENAFELFATPTRTTTDGMSTSWAAADEINVFHAVAGTENYVHDTPYDSASGGGTPFTIAAEDLETGRFTGNLAEALDGATEYDWYLFYPYSRYIETPANVNGFSTIGHRDDGSMTQNGNSDMSHVSGENCPLYGIATNVPGSQTPDIVMHHLTSVLEVVVTNNATEEITVSRITFKTANEKIVGRFYIDFSSDNIVYNPHDTYAVNQASLNVTNGAPIAVGESAKFYLAIKPFTTSNDTLTLTVTTDKGVCEKSIDLTSETSFVAGNIKPLNIGFTVEPGTDPEPLPEGWSLVKNLNQIVDGEYVMVVKTNYGTGYLPTDETSTPTFKTDITIDEENGLITSAVTDNMKWTFSGTASSMTITNINGDALYITNTSKGVKVGTSADFRWTIAAHTSGTNAFSFTSSTVSRFLGVYIDNSNSQAKDWRCYSPLDYQNFKDDSGNPVGSMIYLYKRTGEILPALAAPTGLNVSNSVVTWNAVENAGSYTVTVGSVSETVSETSYTYTGEAGVFDVSVVANPSDTSSFTQSAAATLTGIQFGVQPLGKPTISVKDITAEGFTISWPAVANATGYHVFVSSDANGENEVTSAVISEQDGDPYTVTVTGLSAETEYYLQVSALGDGINYSDSERVSTRIVTSSSSQSIDAITATVLGLEYSYSSFSGVSVATSAVYAGNAMKSTKNGSSGYAGGDIQMRITADKNGNYSGIVTTTSGGRAAKVFVTWGSSLIMDSAKGKTINVYGSNTAYTSANDLYNTDTQGTLIGTIVYGTSNELVITGDYQYIGIRPDEGPTYVTQIDVTWDN